MNRRIALVVVAILMVATFGVSAALAQQAADSPPADFCSLLPREVNPGWQVEGNVNRPADCPERAKWAMVMDGQVSRHETWTQMNLFRNGKPATLYFEGPIAIVYRIFLALVIRSQPPSSPPLGFCSIPPPGNPGWQVDGTVRRPDCCPERGHWAMDIAGQVFRYDTWTAMDTVRAGRSATLYFEGQIT